MRVLPLHWARRHITTKLLLHGTMGVAWSLDFTIITVVGSPRTPHESVGISAPRMSRRPIHIVSGVYCELYASQVEILQEPAPPSVLRRSSRPNTPCYFRYIGVGTLPDPKTFTTGHRITI